MGDGSERYVALLACVNEHFAVGTRERPSVWRGTDASKPHGWGCIEEGARREERRLCRTAGLPLLEVRARSSIWLRLPATHGFLSEQLL